MKHKLLSRREQLHTDPSPAQEFSLEDIMAEFGSALSPASPPAEPAAPEEPEVRIWSPRKTAVPPPEEPEMPERPAEPEKRTPVRKRRPAPPPVPEEDPREEEKERLLRFPRRWHLPEADEEEPEEAAPAPEPPETAAERCRGSYRRLRPMAVASWVLFFLELAAVLLSRSPWPVAEYLPVSLCNTATLAGLALHALLAGELLIFGVSQAVRGKFTLQGMLVILTAVTLVRGLVTPETAELTFSLPTAFLLTVGLWGMYLREQGRLRTFSLILRTEGPRAASRYEAVWQGQDGIFRTEADLSHLTEDILSRPRTETAINSVALALTAVTLVIAGVLALRAGRDFLWTWNLLLLGACPLGGVLAFDRTFCRASRQLKSCGTALMGYAGAKRLGGEACVVVTDDDLFPQTHITLNGIKVFGEHSAERLLGYAAALLQKGGAPNISRVFDELLTTQNARRYRTGAFRAYEAGGFGGEIQDSIVLLGSLDFMTHMGIEIPADTRLKQALYIAVDGQAEGVFAISYHASDPVRSGLSALLSCKKLTVVLGTRDALLTPGVVRMKYGIPGELLEYPESEERAVLASAAEGEGQQGAVLARGSFLSFSMAVAVARQLCRSVRGAFLAALLSAAIGILLTTVFSVTEARAAAGAMQMLAYHALWLLPTALMTGRIRA